MPVFFGLLLLSRSESPGVGGVVLLFSVAGRALSGRARRTLLLRSKSRKSRKKTNNKHPPPHAMSKTERTGRPVVCFASTADWPAVEAVLNLQKTYNGVKAAVTDIVKNGRSVNRPFPQPTHVLVEFESAAQRAAGRARAVLTFTTDPYDKEDDCPLTITSLYVRKEARRAGVGRRMVGKVVDVANKRSFYSINLMSELSARPFWESIGFFVGQQISSNEVNMCMPLAAARRDLASGQ